MSTIRAVGLLSGGLDSALAARLMLDQGIEVIGLHLESPTACRSDVREVARDLGIRLVARPKGEEYLRLLRHPRWGYGRNMNPCVDCRQFMFRLGRPYLEEFDARFLFTGEVVGQRPMSQMRDRLMLIDRAAGLEGWIVRPLSAQLLPETEPERRGWVDRTRLLAISGRSRQAQLGLADRYGLRHYMSPGGGCLLTDAGYSRKLRDLFDHTPEERTTLVDVSLLSIGRHVRLGPGVKVVLGRNEGENRALATFVADGRWIVEPEGFNAPSALVCGPCEAGVLERAVALMLRYARTVPADAAVRWRADGVVRLQAVAELVAAGGAEPGAAAPAPPVLVTIKAMLPAGGAGGAPTHSAAPATGRAEGTIFP
jgi:tRNA-uridine 2-sulfurtransferase